ncbi:hypothetical protein N9169_04325, partial [Algibacter sp.]|nr:hypothetical protein [Algibacter sp.]
KKTMYASLLILLIVFNHLTAYSQNKLICKVNVFIGTVVTEILFHMQWFLLMQLPEVQIGKPKGGILPVVIIMMQKIF